MHKIVIISEVDRNLWLALAAKMEAMLGDESTSDSMFDFFRDYARLMRMFAVLPQMSVDGYAHAMQEAEHSMGVIHWEYFKKKKA